jgi:hypothetical protein
MFTPRLTIILRVEFIRTRSRVVLSLRSLRWLKETLHRGRTLALPSTVFPLEPATAPAVGPNPRLVLPYSEQGVDAVNQRAMAGRN